MKYLIQEYSFIIALFITGAFSLALIFLNPDNIYLAMEKKAQYFTEDFSMRIDLDCDGSEELIENQSFSDGGHVCSVYKLVDDTIYVGYVSDLLNEPYDKTGIGTMNSYYDKKNNSVLFIYKYKGEYKNAVRNLDINNLEFVPLDPMLYGQINYEESRV